MNSDSEKSSEAADRGCAVLQISVLIASSITSVALFFFVFVRSNAGFDLTDESFYLLWISQPWNYAVSATQFGFVYNPLYKITGGHLVLLRQANLAIIFALALMLTYVFFQTILKEKSGASAGSGGLASKSPPWLVRVGLSIALASVALLIFTWWLPTPNYNILGFQALLLAAIGALLADREFSWRSLAGWCVLSIAGWLSFMAKPTSAMALGVVIGIYLVIAGKIHARLLLVSISLALLLLIASAWVIDGSIVGFARRLISAASLYEKVGAGHTISNAFRIDTFVLDSAKSVFYYAVLIAVFCLSMLTLIRKIDIFVYAVLFVGCVFVLLFLFEEGFYIRCCGIFESKLSFLLFMGGFIASLVVSNTNLIKVALSRKFALAALLFSFPYVYAFGTGNNYWITGSMAGIFWILSAVALLSAALPERRKWGVFLPVIVTAQLVTTGTVVLGMEDPYRQLEPLRVSEARIAIGEGGAMVNGSQDLSEYVSSVRAVARKSGFKVGDPIIDLTGYHPGTAVILGGKAVGQPWLVGGYPGSRDFAEGALDTVSCDELAASWVLAQDSSPRGLPSDLLRRYGIDISRDFEKAGTFVTPRQGQYKAYEQVLLKPSRPIEDGRKACELKQRLRREGQVRS